MDVYQDQGYSSADSDMSFCDHKQPLSPIFEEDLPKTPENDSLLGNEASMETTDVSPTPTCNSEMVPSFIKVHHVTTPRQIPKIPYIDPLSPYLIDTYNYKKSLEKIYHPKACLENQKDIQPEMRDQLITWLCKVHHQCNYSSDTIFLTVNIIDRFLAQTNITINVFQLLGVSAYLIATKLEEISVPEVTDLLYYTCHTYTYNQLIQMEAIILQKLRFDFNVPTSNYFLEHYCTLQMRQLNCCHDEETPTKLNLFRQVQGIARFILELTITDYNITQHPPSVIAIATLKVAEQWHLSEGNILIHLQPELARLDYKACFEQVQILAKQILTTCTDLEQICLKYMDPIA
ncbi:unnamed protein product [Owenia fusiformis]|uniref:Uncharacterized protein n=1 Tax=Owenia fusiformis TaxID=6347 RepID=A0A8J1Y939_OWEFU|nr:unnamed protein product [Owenia fusiformis]